ncbi:MAG: hypothetical protein WB508_00620 [Aeromicrobium sp.]|uniref:hypothetical protein n=1 Tax=Aeromicrobium sp. TaxID=1871063 RepID=UPI003C46B2D0
MSNFQRRRVRRADRLYDTYAGGLMALASTLTNTRDRAERLVVDAISRQSRRGPGWGRRRNEQRDMAGSLHARWVETHAPRGPRVEGDTSERARLHDLTDQQLGLVGLCMFGGYSYARAGSAFSLSPAEASGQLRDALRTLVVR